MTKKEIIEKLIENGIEFEASAKKDELLALLEEPVERAAVVTDRPDVEKAVPKKGKFEAVYYVAKRKIYVGEFDSPEEARRALVKKGAQKFKITPV